MADINFEMLKKNLISSVDDPKGKSKMIVQIAKLKKLAKQRGVLKQLHAKWVIDNIELERLMKELNFNK